MAIMATLSLGLCVARQSLAEISWRLFVPELPCLGVVGEAVTRLAGVGRIALRGADADANCEDGRCMRVGA